MFATSRAIIRAILLAALAGIAAAGSASAASPGPAPAALISPCAPTGIDRWLYCGDPAGDGVSLSAALQTVLDEAFRSGARPDPEVDCYDGELWPYPDQPPVVSGNLQVGSTLSSTTGGWFSCHEYIRSYSWLWHGNSQAPSPDPHGSTYTTAGSDVGAYLWTKVTACNTSQCVMSQYESNHHGPVHSPPPDPPACSDGADNDGDGFVDFRSDDTGDWMGCGSAEDDDEGGQWGDVYMPKDGLRHWRFSVIFRGYGGPADNPDEIRCYTIEGYIDDDVGIPRGPRVTAWHVKLVVDWVCVDGTTIRSIANDYTHEFDWDFPYALANPVKVDKIAALWVRPAAGHGGTRAEAEWDVESCTPSWAPFIGRQCTTRRIWIHIRIFGSGEIQCSSSEGTSVCSQTTAVRVEAFSARPTGGSVVLRWRTSQELGLVGFNVYRDGRKLNAGLLHARGSVQGAGYRFADRHARPRGTSRYRLEAIHEDGTAHSRFAVVRR